MPVIACTGSGGPKSSRVRSEHGETRVILILVPLLEQLGFIREKGADRTSDKSQQQKSDEVKEGPTDELSQPGQTEPCEGPTPRTPATDPRHF